MWKNILKRDAATWKAALQKARYGKKILIATSVGSHLAGTTVESVIAAALTLRGCDVSILLCDSILPACLACWSDVYPDHGKFSKQGPGKDCSDCFGPANRMYESLGLKVHRYSDFLSEKDIIKAAEISETIPFSEIAFFSYEGVAVGEHAMAGALRFFARGTLEGEAYAEKVLRRYLNASLLTAIMMNALIRMHNYESVVFHHGIYVPQGIIGGVCRKNGIHVVNWNPAYRKKCFIFSHHDTYHHTMITEPAEKWMHDKWDEDTDARLMRYLKSRWHGTNDWIWFHEKPKFDLQEIVRKTGIDFSRPCIGLLTSVMWDAVLHYPSNAFKGMLEWVSCTIDSFSDRQDLQLIIRIHPAEIRGTLPARQRMADEIRRLYPKLPANIIVIPPESDVSTYAVMEMCDSVIIYNTKTGVELAAMGIPVIVAGEAWIRNKGFAIDVKDPEDYKRIIERLPLGRRMNKEQQLMAKKYAYHFFFRRMIPLEFMEASEGFPPFRSNACSVTDLVEGRSAGLDKICEGIVHGADFIYHGETIETKPA